MRKKNLNDGLTKETAIQFLSKQDIPKSFCGWCYVLESNNLCHYSSGMLHSINDEPALINESEQKWYKFGVHHRVSGPATIGTFYKAWYFNGVPHRLNGPSLTSEVLSGLEDTYAIHGSYVSKQQYYSNPLVVKTMLHEIFDL